MIFIDKILSAWQPPHIITLNAVICDGTGTNEHWRFPMHSWCASNVTSKMEDFVRVSYKDTSLLTVPTSVSFTKARSYSDTSIFKAISEKTRTSSQTGDDSCLTLPPSPSLKSAVSFEAPVETEVSKPKRKTSRPRSPFSPERALDLLSKLTKNEFVSKVTSSPKLPRRTKSKAKAECENRESVSKFIISLIFIYKKL